MRNSIPRNAALVALLSTLIAPLAVRPAEQNLDEVLACKTLRDGSTLALYRQDLAKPSDAAESRYLPNKSMPFGPLTDTVFYVSYLPPHSALASTVWLTYRAVHFLRPLPKFTGTLVADPSDHPFLIFVESTATESRFSIYKIDIAKHLGDAPLRLNPELREGWPIPVEPLSSVVYKLSARESIDSCYVSAVKAEWTNEMISIRSERIPNVCGPLTTAFDASSDTLADVQRVDRTEIPVLH